MNGKALKSSQLAITVAAVLALSSAVAPSASAKSSSDAIIGTGKGGKANAIIGTGADAIIGTGADAIIGTGRSKSISTDAIIGTGKGGRANAIIGTGADAIIGTGADAIIGTGADAIIGTGRAKSVSVDAIIGTGKQRLLLLGAVDSVSTAEGTIQVLGKSLAVSSAQKIATDLAAGGQFTAMVTGSLASNGGLVDASLRLIPTGYVAGASKVVATGRITAVDQDVGTLSVGSLVVDYTSATATRTPKVGEVVAVVGVQPVRGGTVLAEQIGIR